jgi:hypothetical protein
MNLRKSKARVAVFCVAIMQVLAAADNAVADIPTPAEMRFITRRGDQLFDGEQPFRFISMNIPNLLVIEDAYEFTKPNPWRWPDRFEIEDALESIRQMGGQVARSYVISVYRDGSDMGKVVHVLAPGKFNEEGFRAMDMLVDVSRRKGIRVVIPLVDQHKWWGGIGEYAAFRGKKAADFWTDRQLIDDFKATVRHVITRKNSITGVVYRDDPAIFGWQTGNEISSPPKWTREISAFIKELDPNHLVLDGKSLKGVPVWSLDDPNIDVITTHHYPWGTDHDYTKPIRAAHKLTKGKKAYFVGEFGFVETPHIAKALQAVIDDGISGALLWSLRMHRREGGYYWHMEVGTGRNIYKAYHWPGFESGDRYDERQVMTLVREKAHEIRGIKPPPMPAPAAPKLLPIEHASAISWQGSTGAASYDVWRSTRPGADWEKTAEAISDADVQYRPLFNDASAVPGSEYYYRVVAHNESDESAPSNIVGPVRVDCRTLVDEGRDKKQITMVQGDISLATENARIALEDSHRLGMHPGSSAVYELDGPIDGWRVYSFVRKRDARLEFGVSDDGEHFTPVEVKRMEFPPADTVYGYLLPVLLKGKSTEANARYLRVAMPAPPDGDKRGEPPVEIGRVEIDFDRADSATKSAAEKRSAVPMGATVFVDNPRDVRNTLHSIDAAAERGDRRLNVAVTILVELTNDLKINSFGWTHGERQRFVPCDNAMRAELRNALRQVFARMVHHGMDIYVLPHIDAGGHVKTWRNWVDFDPRKKYAGYSYDDLMLGSIEHALVKTVKPETRVELALSGEMGTSLFKYPDAYREIVRQLRRQPGLSQLKLGISLNHSGISGQGNPTGATPIKLTDASRQQTQSLIDECDFVGMSFYRPVRVNLTTEDFVAGIDHFMSEFDRHGLKIPPGKPMHFSEVGIGGGHEDDDDAGDPAKAVQTPWAGSGTPRVDPWRTAPMRDLRRRYHAALLEFLATQPAKWHVSAAFFWSTGSWDPQGMRHPAFRDPEIVDAIHAHNSAIESRQRSQ